MALTYSAYHRVREIKSEEGWLPLTRMLSGLITLHPDLAVQAIRSWVVCIYKKKKEEKELAQWR